MTLQISKHEPKLLSADLGLYSSGCWVVRGPGVCGMFLFDHQGGRGRHYCGEGEAHRQAVMFMVAMQTGANPAAMLRAHIEADFNKGVEL